jgi:hypothetical protein
MFDTRDPEMCVFTVSGFILFLLLVLARICLRYSDLVPQMFGQIDAFAAKA